MAKDSYKTALENARGELAALVKQRATMDERILRLTKTIEGLEALCTDEGYSAGLSHAIDAEISAGASLSDAIRGIVKASTLPIKVPGIRDQLVEEGYDPNDYSNLLTVIHNTLARLERQGEVYKVRMPMGGFWGWMWNPGSVVIRKGQELVEGQKKK